MADIFLRKDSVSTFLSREGEFHVDQAWLDGLQDKLQKKTDAKIQVSLNDRADRLSVRVSGEGKWSMTQVERLLRRLDRAIGWYIFWHRKQVRVSQVGDYKDRRLGTLVYNRDLDLWEADMPIVIESKSEGSTLRFNLTIQGNDGHRPPADLVARAHKIINSLTSLNRQCLEAIGDEMLEVYNTKGWRGDNPEMSRDQFVKHFRLMSIRIGDEEGDGLRYRPKDQLFTEHGVTVTLTDGTISHVALD